MMPAKWLVTIARDRLEAVTARLRALGCQVVLEAVVPIDDDVVLPASGPKGVEREIARIPGVRAVHPDSDFTMY